jgi:hypothetical protein
MKCSASSVAVRPTRLPIYFPRGISKPLMRSDADFCPPAFLGNPTSALTGGVFDRHDADRNRMGSATSADAVDDAKNIPVLVQYKAWREPSRLDWITSVRPA